MFHIGHVPTIDPIGGLAMSFRVTLPWPLLPLRRCRYRRCRSAAVLSLIFAAGSTRPGISARCNALSSASVSFARRWTASVSPRGLGLKVPSVSRHQVRISTVKRSLNRSFVKSIPGTMFACRRRPVHAARQSIIATIQISVSRPNMWRSTGPAHEPITGPCPSERWNTQTSHLAEERH